MPEIVVYGNDVGGGMTVTRTLVNGVNTIVTCASMVAVAHAIQSHTGLSIAEVVKQLRPLRSATVNINGSTQTFPPAIPNAQREILSDLGMKPGC